jgi:hypothetical protein
MGLGQLVENKGNPPSAVATGRVLGPAHSRSRPCMRDSLSRCIVDGSACSAGPSRLVVHRDGLALIPRGSFPVALR